MGAALFVWQYLTNEENNTLPRKSVNSIMLRLLLEKSYDSYLKQMES